MTPERGRPGVLSRAARALLGPVRRIADELGSPARRHVIALLASVLALEGADLATVGALATELKGAFGVGDAGIGLLVTASILTGAVATLPIGVLTDRVDRTRLLAASIALWGAAMLAGALSPSFTWLLLSRIVLGAVTATAGPTVASLTGDLFPSGERARIYGYITAGELLGAGVGFLMVGTVAGALDWRAAFGLLVLPACALAVAVWRLPEPARGGQSRLEPEATRIVPAEEANGPAEAGDDDERSDKEAERVARRAGARPVPTLVLREDPSRLGLPAAVRYVLSIRSNVVLIVAGALIVFYATGLRTFAVEYARARWGLGQAPGSLVVVVIGAGALIGVVLSGRTADRRLERGDPSARLVVAAAACGIAVLLFVPGLLASMMVIAIPILALASAGLAAPNPPLDAARLDVVPSGLWGRAESVRTVLRALAVALAPISFGLVSEALGSGGTSLGAEGSGVPQDGGRALELTFLAMLGTLIVAGAALLWGARRYPADVLSATESERAATDDAGRAPAPTTAAH
jgi:predicted MFS family arabinose efflux permease